MDSGPKKLNNRRSKINREGKFKSKVKTKRIAKMQLKGVPIKSKPTGLDYQQKIQKTKEKSINYIKESEILTIYNEDAFVISEKPFLILDNLRQLLRMLYTFLYALSVFGSVSLLFILGIIIAIVVSQRLFKLWSKFNVESREIKVTR